MNAFFCVAAVLLLSHPANATTDTLPAKKKEISAVDVSRDPNKFTITYTDGTKETMSETEADKKRLVHNGGYGNFRQSNAAQVDATLRLRSDSTKPLTVLDGKEYSGELKDIEPSSITTINVLKGPAAIHKYGVKGRNGVIEIVRKPVASTATTEAPDEWLGQKLYQLLGALPTDEILSFSFSAEDHNEDVMKVEQQNKLTDKGRDALNKARKGSVIIFENIRVKRNGKEMTLPVVYYKK